MSSFMLQTAALLPVPMQQALAPCAALPTSVHQPLSLLPAVGTSCRALPP